MDRFRVMYQVTALLLVLAVAALAQPRIREKPTAQVFAEGQVIDGESGLFVFRVIIWPLEERGRFEVELLELTGVTSESPLAVTKAIEVAHFDTTIFAFHLTGQQVGSFRFRVRCGEKELRNLYCTAMRTGEGLEITTGPAIRTIAQARPEPGSTKSTAHPCHGYSGGEPCRYVEYRSEPGSTRFTINIRIVQDTLMDSLIAGISDLGNVLVYGPSEYRRNGHDALEQSFQITAELVGADTGYFKSFATHVFADIPKGQMTVYRSGDSVAFYYGDLRASLETKRKTDEYLRPKRFRTTEDSLHFVEDSTLQAQYAPDGVWWIGHDDAGDPVPMTKEEFDRQWESTLETMKQKQEIDSQRSEELKNRRRTGGSRPAPEPTPEEKYQQQLQEMRELEKTPLADFDGQHFMLGDTLYERFRGETKFRVAKPADRNDSNYWRPDSAEADKAAASLTYERIFDLRDSAHYKLVKSLVDSLLPAGEPGFYRGVTNKYILERIEAAKVPFTVPNRLPSRSEPRPDAKPQGRNNATSVQSAPNAAITDTVLFEGGELGWQWQYGWVTGDLNANSGWYTWLYVIPYHWPHAGNWDIWCAGEDMPVGSLYANNMIAEMYTSDNHLLDLSGHSSNVLSFWIMGLVEDIRDYCRFQVKYGSTWYTLGSVNSDITSWQNRQYSLLDTSGVGLRFEFYSDASITDYGMFLDNITVTGSRKLPNLVMQAPVGWYRPLVLSPTLGDVGYNKDTVPANTPVYMNWSIRNIGTAAAPVSYTDIYVDGYYWDTWGAIPLNVGQYDDDPWNIPITLSPGQHTVTVIADGGNSIPETNDNDNSYSRTIYAVDNRPDLQKFAKLYWGDGFVVSRSYGGRYSTDVLYWLDTAYVSYVIKNTGQSPAGPFQCQVKVNGSVIHTKSFAGLANGATDSVKTLHDPSPADQTILLNC